ncbi:VOC family protein [bacterium]|nr:VOC family protein [bacterium]
MGNPIVHFEIGWPKPKEAVKFYSNLFDWDIEWVDEMNYGVIKTGDEPGGGIMGQEDNPPHLTIYIHVDSVDDYLAKAEKLGATVVLPKTAIPNVGFIGAFRDPENQLIGLMQGLKEE